MIGGFFFLRFINPAIVTPRAYMLLDTAPGNAPRRTLTLVGEGCKYYFIFVYSFFFLLGR